MAHCAEGKLPDLLLPMAVFFASPNFKTLKI